MGNDIPERLSWSRIPRHMALYFLNNTKLILRFSRQLVSLKFLERSAILHEGPATVIDTVLYLEKLRDSGKLSFANMPGLEEALTEANKHAILAPVVYGDLDSSSRKNLRQAIRTSSFPVLLAHQAFSFMDGLRLLAFTIGYPFALLWFLLRLDKTNKENRLVIDECIQTMGAGVIQEYLRYLYGRGIARQTTGDLTAISWCENRAGDKLFYKGLRSHKANVRIIGVQTFIFPDHYFGCYINRSEADAGYAPDEIIVNGPYFLPQSETIKARVGYSMRYNDIFTTDVGTGGTDILILLSHNEEASRQLLKFLRTWDISEKQTIKVRLHPSHPCQKWVPLLPSGAIISEGSLIKSLASAQFAIGTETGAMLEAIACGIPVISVATIGQNSLVYMPMLGKGEIWFEANSTEEIQQAIKQAMEVSTQTKQHYASLYKKTFFNRPIQEKLLESFGL